MRPTWEGVLALIFNGFSWILEAKLGRKMEENRAKTGEDRGRQGKTREGKGREEEGKREAGIGREKMSGGLFAPGGVGFVGPLGGNLPGALDRGLREASQRLISTFCPSWCPSFLYRFFDAFLDRFLVDFRPQLAFQNPPKSIKNRCQAAFPC